MPKNNNKKLYISFTVGYGFSKDLKQKCLPIEIGVSRLDKEMREKYGEDLTNFLKKSKQKGGR